MFNKKIQDYLKSVKEIMFEQISLERKKKLIAPLVVHCVAHHLFFSFVKVGYTFLG